MRRFFGGTEGLGTKIVGAFKGVLEDFSFGDFEADGSGIFGKLVQTGTHIGHVGIFEIMKVFSFYSLYSPFRSTCECHHRLCIQLVLHSRLRG